MDVHMLYHNVRAQANSVIKKNKQQSGTHIGDTDIRLKGEQTSQGPPPTIPKNKEGNPILEFLPPGEEIGCGATSQTQTSLRMTCNGLQTG